MKLSSILPILFILLGAHAAPAHELRAADPAAFLRQSNLLLLKPKLVTAEPQHRGYNIITHDGGRPWRTIEIGDLKHNHDQWIWEPWDVDSARSHYFYDMGFVHLADDAITMNAWLTSAMTDPELPNLRLEYSHSRQMSLSRLHQFNDIFAGSDRDPGNSYIDSFAILNKLVSWNSTRREIDPHLFISAQIHYGEHRNYLKPSVKTLVHHLGFAPPPRALLPLFRGENDREGVFKTEMEAEFAGDQLCQITFPRGDLPTVSRQVRNAFFLKILDRAEERGCTALVIVLPRTQLAIMRDYGFEAWRSPPDDATQWVFMLRVNSREFLFAYDDCQENLAPRRQW